MRQIPGVKRMFLEGDELKEHNRKLKEQLDRRLGADRHEHHDVSKEHDLKLGPQKVW